MRLGAGIGRDDPAALVKRAQGLEKAGVEVLWASELYGMDAVSLMGFLACATETVSYTHLDVYKRQR